MENSNEYYTSNEELNRRFNINLMLIIIVALLLMIIIHIMYHEYDNNLSHDDLNSKIFKLNNSFILLKHRLDLLER